MILWQYQANVILNVWETPKKGEELENREQRRLSQPDKRQRRRGCMVSDTLSTSLY